MEAHLFLCAIRYVFEGFDADNTYAAQYEMVGGFDADNTVHYTIRDGWFLNS